MRFIGDDVRPGDIDIERQRPLAVIDVAGLIGRNKDAGGDDNRVQSSISEQGVVEHARDAFATGDVARHADCRATIANPRAANADACTVFRDDLLRGFFCCWICLKVGKSLLRFRFLQQLNLL